ncbi:hypothetical protein Pth03_09470 [Planotetraspora thailandica]|uniref:DUF4291 domain-containing protein n=1 Tax=Planotetraspora thailandica TaxID=487172 RepID=A0A8J3UV59_9ACTN|nr:DUF4291 domain-containing protein [Planotetraspora thailandica]GII52558.1 hypothetical protein Pth03_09470 [Planotetraspora thailandica]
MNVPNRQIRAAYTEESITVYQAYSPAIAGPAVAAQRFVPPFKRERMTWIKPSFCWMMYRCGWAAKPGQGRVLAIDITREGFEWALAHSCLSHPDRAEGRQVDHAEWRRRLHESPVRIQWDPERDRHLRPLPHRSIQIGLSGEAVERFVDDWIVAITDVTARVHELHADRSGDFPVEHPYPLTADLARTIGATPDSVG